jgi:hypothetical protein
MCEQIKIVEVKRFKLHTKQIKLTVSIIEFRRLVKLLKIKF